MRRPRNAPVMGAIGLAGTHLFSVAQTSKSAVSRVSKPAGRNAAEPTWKSAIQQVWKPALPNLGKSALNRYGAPAQPFPTDGFQRNTIKDDFAGAKSRRTTPAPNSGGTTKQARVHGKNRRTAPAIPAGTIAQVVYYEQLKQEQPLATASARGRTGGWREIHGFGPKRAEKKE